MAVSAFIRCSHFRRLIGVSNNAVALFPDSAWYLNRIKSQSYATFISEIKDTTETNAKKPEKKKSKAMMMYLQRAKEHDEFMKKEILEYKIGKRHLANIMGKDPESFTQADINRSIQYLFPSGLFERKARPIMEHPEKIFPNRKAAEFDETGKPFHSMFYTSKPNYYETLYNIIDNIKSLNDIEDSLIKQGTLPMNDKIDLVGVSWLSKKNIEKLFLENINDLEYNYLIASLERLCDHPLSKRVTDFIFKYCRRRIHSKKIVVLPLEHDSTGRPYVTVKNCMRKSARGEVTIWGNGSGKIVINGHDIAYFEDFQHRQQVIELNTATGGDS